MADFNELTQYYELLCNTLKKNGFQIKVQIGSTIHNVDYKPDYNHLKLTMLGITEDQKVYDFLKRKNLIRNDICHNCGEHPIDNSFTFKEPNNKIIYSICRVCHSKGSREQKIYKKAVKESSGCLLLLGIIFSMILIIILK